MTTTHLFYFRAVKPIIQATKWQPGVFLQLANHKSNRNLGYHDGADITYLVAVATLQLHLFHVGGGERNVVVDHLQQQRARPVDL